MNGLPEIVRLTTSFWGLVGLLVLLTVVFHVLFIGVLRLDKAAWTTTNYAILLIGALGLIKLTSDSRTLIAKSLIAGAEEQTEFALHNLRAELAASDYLCAKHMRTPLSPANFDEIEAHRALVCGWVLRAREMAPENDDPPFKPLSFAESQFPDVTDEPLVETEHLFRRLFDEYEDRRLNLEELQGKSKQGNAEIIYTAVVAPLLISISLALGITKVTGEILLHRQEKDFASGKPGEK